MRRPVIKHFFEAGNSIPVERAQDLAKVGNGTIRFVDNVTIEGKLTSFVK
jgi:hypothetical protein